MPHPKYGKTAALLNSGGCIEGPPQAKQIEMLQEAGITFDYIICNSVGAWNGVRPDMAWRIWRTHITSPEAIWDYGLEIKALRSAIESIPHEPFRHPVAFVKFLLRAFENRPRIWSAGSSTSDFSKLTDTFLALAKIYGLTDMQSFFTLDPLVKTLKQHLDLSNFFTQNTKVHILARSIETGKEHIFSNKEEDEAKGENFHYIKSVDEIFLAAKASTALRLIFPPVEIRGNLYCDAGDGNPLPIDYAFDESCDTIFVFTREYKYSRGRDPLHIHFETSEISLINFFHHLKHAATVRARKEVQKLFFITPQYPLHPDYWLLGVSEAALEHTEKVETEAMQKWISDNLVI